MKENEDFGKGKYCGAPRGGRKHLNENNREQEENAE